MSSSSRVKPTDPSRNALLLAFRDLVLGGRYEDLKVTQIASRARVARSTFYMHFRTKDELLMEGLSDPFGALADAVAPGAPPDDLAATLDHLWENRRVARSLLTGPMRRPAANLLAGMIEARLGVLARGRRVAAPLRLVAHQVAGGQLAAITAWVSGEAPCTVPDLAVALRAMSQAVVVSALGPPLGNGPVR
ncbi:MAG: TetR/AcrR family transcriptional regulator [Phenylobacterium sp.]